MQMTARSAIEQFASSVGLPARVEGSECAFTFSETGRLSFIGTPDERDLVVSLSFGPSASAATMKALLSMAGYDAHHRMFLAVGMNEHGHPVLAVRLTQSALNMQQLLHTFDYLKSKRRSVA